MGDINSDLGTVLNQQPKTTQALPGILEALVVSADATGVRVKIPSFHPDWAFGPCSFSWPGTGYPPPNTRCLIQFVGDDLTTPWIVAWANAPQPQGLPLALTGAASPTRYVGGTLTGPPTTGTFALGDYVIAADGRMWICNGGGSPGTWVDAGAGAAAASRGLPIGLTGATAPTRYVGGTTTGHPATGTFAAGDFAVADNGVLWVCTAAGTPGTWVASYAPALGQPAGLTVAAARFVGGTVSGAPSAGSFIAGDYVIDQAARVWICTVAGSPGTWVDAAAAAAAAVKGMPLALTGATAASRFAGGTASGAPTTGTFAKGDYVVAQDGQLWICTVAGTPGTWVSVDPTTIASDIAALKTAVYGGSTRTRAPICALYLTANRQIAANTDTFMDAQWSVGIDTDSIWHAGVQPGGGFMQIPVAGRYRVDWVALVGGTTDALYSAKVLLNGVTISSNTIGSEIEYIPPGVNESEPLTLRISVHDRIFAAGDKLYFSVWINNGGYLYYSWFGGMASTAILTWIGPN